MHILEMRARRLRGRAASFRRRMQARLTRRPLMVRPPIIGLTVGLAVFVSAIGAGARGQGKKTASDPEAYTRGNSWTLFGEYAPNSSQIIWGVAEKRARLAFGGEYGRRVVRGHGLEFDCMVQVKPGAFEKDPTLVGFRSVSTGQILVRIMQPRRVTRVNNAPFFLPNIGEIARVYGSEWTYGFEMDPIGLKLNFRARRRLQPFIDATGGFVVTTRDIPIDNASSFNYEFGFGAGFDYFLRARRSMRFGYAYRHISNNGLGFYNPGIDAAVIEIGYSFGR